MLRSIRYSLNHEKHDLYKSCFSCKNKIHKSRKILYFDQHQHFTFIDSDKWYKYWHICPHCGVIYNEVDTMYIEPIIYKEYEMLHINFRVLYRLLVSKITVSYFHILQHFNKLKRGD